jgi:hypothetical protein
MNNQNEPAPATSATPTAKPTTEPQIVENRDLAAAVPATADAPEPTAPCRRTTRQFDLGDGRRLVDMRTTSGPVEIIPEAPGVNFDGLPTMSRDDAIRAALDLDGSDAERLALIRQIVETPDAANVRQIATATH